MFHTYEVLVDIKEYTAVANNGFHSGTTRYEIDAESKQTADRMARVQARNEHPQAVECEVRVTRLLK